MTFERVVAQRHNHDALKQPITVDEWLGGLMEERSVLIMRLRQIERHLIKHGKIKGESIDRRIR